MRCSMKRSGILYVVGRFFEAMKYEAESIFINTNSLNLFNSPKDKYLKIKSFFNKWTHIPGITG